MFTPIIEEMMMSSWMKNGIIWSSKFIGIILLYDITSKESFLHLESICVRLLALRLNSGDTSAQADKVNQPAIDDSVNGTLVATMVGTKSDSDSERQVEYAQGRALAARFGCSFLEVSSMSGSNVARVFDDLVRAMQPHRAPEQPKSSAQGDGVLRSREKVGRRCTIV